LDIRSPGGWVPPRNEDDISIPWLSLARVQKMFPTKQRQNTGQRKQNVGRKVQRDNRTDSRAKKGGLHGDRGMGVRSWVDKRNS